MAHFPVRHPFGASIATAMLFKILPDDFVEPTGSHQSLSAPDKTKGSRWEPFVLYGGERGIRTLDTVLPYTHFPGVLLQPLGHLSGRLLTARVYLVA
jgi:hypothetical protein